MIHHEQKRANRVRQLAALTVALCTSLVPLSSVRAQDSEVILRKLELMEAEIAALKLKLKQQEEQQAQAAKAPQTPPHTEPAHGIEEATKGEGSSIDEAMFRPQGSTASSSTVSSAPQDQPPPLSTTSAASAQRSAEYEKRLKELGEFGITYRSDGFMVDALRFGAYGESIFGRTKSDGSWRDGFDANRIVLLGTYQVSNDIIFNTEIEFEHGGIAKDEDDKLNGAVEVEQLFIDFRANDHFTWRSPGVDVVPVGYINLFHEPTQFYSTYRPELYDTLIPSTWYAASTSAYGQIVDGLNYQVQLGAGLEDVGTTADDNGRVPQGGYEAGISGTEALGLAKAPIGDRSQVGNNISYTARLSYAPPFIPGLSGSSSVYYTDDTTPRGAYGTNPNGSTRSLGKSSLSLLDTEVRYRVPTTGIELRSEYVAALFGDTDNLRANNDGDATNNVGSDMYGYSFEAAYHQPFSTSEKEPWEFVPFYRFSQIELQTGGVRGTDLNDPTGSGSRRYHTFGAALFPTRKVVLKADYQLLQDKDSQSSAGRALMGAVGFFF